MAERIQLRRTARWRLPDGAVRVAPGSSRWGNPFMVGCNSDLLGTLLPVRDRAHAVDLYREWLRRRPDLVAIARRDLAGRDLACWCPLPAAGEPDVCHAVVLLRVAAGGEP